MNAVSIIPYEKARPPTDEELTDPHLAYEYAWLVMGVRWPRGEATIAKDPCWAFWYASDVLRDRWPMAETTIMRAPYWAMRYAQGVLFKRWIEAEETIAKSDWKDNYLMEFPEAKDEWVTNGWIDWLDT